jgi:hypothetical protein
VIWSDLCSEFDGKAEEDKNQSLGVNQIRRMEGVSGLFADSVSTLVMTVVERILLRNVVDVAKGRAERVKGVRRLERSSLVVES